MGAAALAPALLCLALRLLAADGFVLHMELDCPLAADGHVLWANWTLAFNKVPFLCYDNENQLFVPCGLGEFGNWPYASYPISEKFNQHFPAWGKVMEALCREQVQSQPLWGQSGARRTPPHVHIFPITPQNTPAPLMLACDVWGFYPADVAVTWLRNGAFVKNSTGVPVVSNGDWTYQTRLSLPVFPQRGDVYTCLVDHASLPEPMTRAWEPGLPSELKVIVGVSTAVLGVGLILLIAGLACWSKRVPEGYTFIDGTNYPPVIS
ncbi:HLA class II histocompatibility antigen, DM beta chain [Eublepharis macularius]|uniref:HLA class II histocompatibility antigen, DM beta chain n=1 Tax=Eublepharis macularius TaxID=481883 RepID=A0AA97KYB2_EUBMA|nr:HLA class II histocompatibility antigen, DM beta chain [Eublepharis macularius]